MKLWQIKQQFLFLRLLISEKANYKEFHVYRRLEISELVKIAPSIMMKINYFLPLIRLKSTNFYIKVSLVNNISLGINYMILIINYGLVEIEII